MTVWCEDKENGCLTKFTINGTERKVQNTFKQHYSKKYILKKIVQ